MSAQPQPPRSLIWVGGAFCMALALAAAVIARFGAGERGTDLALAATARLAFLFFWPAYAGGPLVILFGPKFAAVRRRGQALGLAFASVLSIHLSLVAWISWIGHAPPAQTFAIFGVGAVFTGFLALSSVESFSRRLHGIAWSTLRALGMNYLLFDFAFDFFRPRPLRSVLLQLEYRPFQVLVALALAARLLSILKQATRPASGGLAGD
jgi:hypothetical protein